MRTRSGRGLAALSLAVWLASSALGQLLWLHTEVDHAGSHHHHGPQDAALLLHHPGPEDGHQHTLGISTGLPACPGSKLQPPPLFAILPPSWEPSAALGPDVSAPEPRPRGRPFAPQRHAILLI